jgi:GNAT superfamily N-acetyltransferase
VNVATRAGIVTLADRPDLAPAVPALLAERWPVFMLAGRPGHDVDLDRLAVDAPGHQALLLGDDGELLGAALSMPVSWDGTAAGLPAGWDGAVTAGGDLLDRGGRANTYVALSVTLAAAASGQGYTAGLLGALKEAAAAAGAGALIVPVRPVLKTRYPHEPMAEYLRRRTGDGRVFDPWVRQHLDLGATELGIADPSMTITGTVAQWRDWTGLALPASGGYAVPGGLSVLHVDLDRDLGVYREANVWMVHPMSRPGAPDARRTADTV